MWRISVQRAGKQFEWVQMIWQAGFIFGRIDGLQSHFLLQYDGTMSNINVLNVWCSLVFPQLPFHLRITCVCDLDGALVSCLHTYEAIFSLSPVLMDDDMHCSAWHWWHTFSVCWKYLCLPKMVHVLSFNFHQGTRDIIRVHVTHDHDYNQIIQHCLRRGIGNRVPISVLELLQVQSTVQAMPCDASRSVFYLPNRFLCVLDDRSQQRVAPFHPNMNSLFLCSCAWKSYTHWSWPKYFAGDNQLRRARPAALACAWRNAHDHCSIPDVVRVLGCIWNA